MKLTVKTTMLQEMVAKAVKGASNNKMIPITGLLAIEAKNNVLTLTTTDATNTLKVINKVDNNEDFYVVLPVEIFSKLVSKTTTENIVLTLQENSLEMKGNGTYAIDLPLDETGSLTTFPQYVFDTEVPFKTIDVSSIKSLLAANKAALADTMEIPCLTGYYCGAEAVISTDTFKVCNNKVKLFDSPVLLSPELMELLNIISDDKVKVQRNESQLLFTASDIIVYGAELEGIQEYPVEAIKAYLQTEFESSCKLPKATLLNVLDRLSLFVTNYDKNALYMTFTDSGLRINSKKNNGTELIKYTSSDNFKPFTCCINIDLFASQVNAQSTEEVELWYGHDKAIKMISNNITQIVALLEDDRMTENGEG